MEFSAQMARRIHRLLAARRSTGRLSCEVQDRQRLGFDAQTGLREVARVLRHGGWFASEALRRPEHTALAHGQVRPIHAALPAPMRNVIPRVAHRT